MHSGGQTHELPAFKSRRRYNDTVPAGYLDMAALALLSCPGVGTDRGPFIAIQVYDVTACNEKAKVQEFGSLGREWLT